VTVVDRPVRGTRPANRRELILAAATELVASRGFEHVSVGEIAAAVAVGPSALYRHFSGKDEILAEVIVDLGDRFTALMDSLEDPEREQLLPAVATFALDHRSAGVLWQRELRHLPAAYQAMVRARIGGAHQRLAAAVLGVRPELGRDAADAVASGVLAVVLSPSFHRVELPRPAFDALLTGLAGRVLAADLPEGFARARREQPRGLPRTSRRERLLDAAIRLFAERTYASVSMEDVAASVGMAASSLYNHFPRKLDLLVSALHRANGYLQLTLGETLAAARDPATGMRDLVTCYVRFAMGHTHLVDVLITEVRNLPPEDAPGLLQEQRAYVDEWVHLLRQVHAELDGAAARVVVHAALMVINDLARNAEVRSLDAAEAMVTGLGCRVLDV
jgi:AcrR family transcriptional regulator